MTAATDPSVFAVGLIAFGLSLLLFLREWRAIVRLKRGADLGTRYVRTARRRPDLVLRFCPRCSKHVGPERFCPRCGERLGDPAPPPAAKRGGENPRPVGPRPAAPPPPPPPRRSYPAPGTAISTVEFLKAGKGRRR